MLNFFRSLSRYACLRFKHHVYDANIKFLKSTFLYGRACIYYVKVAVSNRLLTSTSRDYFRIAFLLPLFLLDRQSTFSVVNKKITTINIYISQDLLVKLTHFDSKREGNIHIPQPIKWIDLVHHKRYVYNTLIKCFNKLL